jgi:hypothetical protein
MSCSHKEFETNDMGLKVYSSWHNSIAKKTPCVQDIKISGEAVTTVEPISAPPVHTESKQMLLDLDDEDSTYIANLANYMAGNTWSSAHSKL